MCNAFAKFYVFFLDKSIEFFSTKNMGKVFNPKTAGGSIWSLCGFSKNIFS